MNRSGNTSSSAWPPRISRSLICGGTGCVAGGSLKIYDRLKELMEERDIACTVQLEEEPHDHSIGPEKKAAATASAKWAPC